jgi:hypothetical protein
LLQSLESPAGSADPLRAPARLCDNSAIMLRMLSRLLVFALIIWIVATVISPSYDLPNTVMRAGKFAPATGFDFLFTAAILLLYVTRYSPLTRAATTHELCSVRLLARTCVLLC